jgi:hypothetical protein
VRDPRVPTWMLERGEIGRYAYNLHVSADCAPRLAPALTASYFYGARLERLAGEDDR